MLEQLYRLHENEKKRMYVSRVLEIEQATFTPLVLSTTGGIGRKCLRYRSRLTHRIDIHKERGRLGKELQAQITWLRGKVSFCILRSALLWLIGSRLVRRRAHNILELSRSRAK